MPMMLKLLAFLVLLLTSMEVHAMTPKGKKNNAKEQADTLASVAEEFELAAESLPTKEGVKEAIRKLDAAEQEKLDKDVEDADKVKPAHLCEGPEGRGDYSIKCPEEWQEIPNGECWGRKYRGPCDAMSDFNEFSEDDKISFEHDCCAFWPRVARTHAAGLEALTPKVITAEAEAKRHLASMHRAVLHGPVDAVSGSVIPGAALL